MSVTIASLSNYSGALHFKEVRCTTHTFIFTITIPNYGDLGVDVKL
jgi:hypothetical protein